MRRILLCALLALTCANPVSAQKLSPLYGEAWLGEVVSASEATREVTIRSVEKGATETFTGFLEEGYKVKREDGGPDALKFSDLAPGARVRVFYRTQKNDVGRRKEKAHSIFRVDFLGADEYARLRGALKLAPAAAVAPAESEVLPAAAPLKMYLAVEPPFIRDRFVAWAGRWNKERGAKYGPIELVADPAHSDISLVVYRGSDRMSMELPAEFSYRSGDVQSASLSHVTTYVVADAGGRPKVLWKRVIVNSRVGGIETASVEIEKEFEKRMKARSKGPQK